MRWTRRRRIPIMVAAAFLLAPATSSATSVPGNGVWHPGPRRYGITTQRVQVRMSDGIYLSATVSRPTNPATGKPAAGRFPVILVATPYGKDEPAFAGVNDTPATDYVPYGYIDVVVDVRGTGSSGGAFELLGPREARDYVEVIRWAAHMAGSSGRVGMTGESYLGLAQLLAAGSVGPHSPLKAIFPILAAPDMYRDMAVPGGMFDSLFDTPYSGLEIGMDTLGPLFSGQQPQQTAQTLGLHLEGNAQIDGQTLANAFNGGDRAYDESFWRQRDLSAATARIPRNRVAVFAYNSLFDIWQRGDPMVYSLLQNAADDRPARGPMIPSQRVSGRYQVALGPYFHVDAGADHTLNALLGSLSLEWFDTWLKGRRTGMQRTANPLHAYELAGGRWIDTATWPPAPDRAETLYFAPGPSSSGALSLNDGMLRPTPPRSSGSDRLAWNGNVDTPCSQQNYQEINAVALLYAPYDNPCIYDDRTFELGGLSYTTAPLPAAVDIAGPAEVTIYATANTTNTEWVATLSIVTPNGAARPLTTGDLIGSLRATVGRQSWHLGRALLMPWHPYTRGSERPVAPGRLERYDLDLSGTVAHAARGDRIRITVQSADAPYAQPTFPDSTQLLGGSYRVAWGGLHPSSITLGIAAPSKLRTSGFSWGPCRVHCRW